MPLFVLLALWISNAVSETLRPGEYFTLYTKNFYEFPGAEITLKGAYEFCNPTYCPRCIRVMYLKFGKLAKCSGGKDPSKLRNCWKYNFAVKARVPMKYGFSRITAHSLLAYRCGTIPNNAKGVLVGTIRVGNPLFWIAGQRIFTASPGGTILVAGCYKYCRQNLYCPGCLRKVYFHAMAGSSTCAAHINAGAVLDCKPYCVTTKVKVPNKPGNYSIRAYELLEYKCRANDFAGGVRVGTVNVQECRKGGKCACNNDDNVPVDRVGYFHD